MSQLSPAYVLVHITNLSVPSTLAILIGLFKAMDKGNLNSELLFHWNPSFWGFFFGFFFFNFAYYRYCCLTANKRVCEMFIGMNIFRNSHY